MTPIKYPYSIFQNCFSIILVSAMNIFILYMIIRFPALPGSLALSALFLCTATMAVYLCRKFFFPSLRGEIALELDKDKLQFFITDRTIYWKDVKSINYDVLNHGGWAIIFAFKNGSENVDISTKYIAGNNQAIYDTITEYFEKY